MRFLRTYKVFFLIIFFILYVPLQSFSQSDSISNSFQCTPKLPKLEFIVE